MIVPVVLAAVVAILVSSSVVFIRGFARVEADEMHERVQRVVGTINAELRQLDADVVDYAAWDDTCAYLAGRDPGYVERNLVDSLFTSFRLNMLVILDSTGAVVYQRGFDLEKQEGVPLAKEWESHLRNGSSLADHPSAFSAVSGPLCLTDGVWLVASRPVVDSDGEGPIQGTLLMGRVLDQAYVSSLAAQTRLSLNVRPAQGTLPDDWRAALGSLSAGAPSTVKTPDDNTVAGYGLLKDVYGGSGLLLRVDAPRVVYAQGKLSIISFVVMLVGILLGLGLVLVLLLERSVLRPLAYLARGVKTVRVGGEPLTGKGSAEFVSLAGDINHLVRELAGSERELRQRYDDARHLAERDPLTGLLNRRALFQRLEGELHTARRSGRQLSLVLMDIDDFKLINDHGGHLKGDEILRKLGTLFRDQARGSDVVGRYGGDEFLAILPGAAMQEAAAFAERIISSVADDSQFGPEETLVQVALSLGISTYPQCGEEINELLAFADANLYRAKALGGGTVTAGPSPGDLQSSDAGSFGMLESLIAAINNKDRYTRKHSEEVAAQAVALAEALGLSERDQRTLRIAGLLHDVGKIGVPEHILRKPTHLDAQEQAAVERHVELGVLLIRDVPNLEDVQAAVGSHHERWDGQGYPHRLQGTEIPLLGRILALVDAYSAMTSRRPYRKPRDAEGTRAELLRAKGTQLDPELVDALLDQCLGRQPGAAQSEASYSPPVRSASPLPP